MTTLQDAVDIGRQDRFLAVVSTLRADATIQSSVVNAGVLSHPVSGEEVVVLSPPERQSWPTSGIGRRSASPFVRGGSGRRSKAGLRSSDLTMVTLTSIPSGFACCFAKCFRRPGVPMTTGMPTTVPWPRSDGLPCSSAFRGSTAIDPSESDGHARLSFVLSFSG